jgi:hypothetical protein
VPDWKYAAFDTLITVDFQLQKQQGVYKSDFAWS